METQLITVILKCNCYETFEFQVIKDKTFTHIEKSPTKSYSPIGNLEEQQFLQQMQWLVTTPSTNHWSKNQMLLDFIHPKALNILTNATLQRMEQTGDSNLLKAEMATMSPARRPSSSSPRAKHSTSSTNCCPVFCRSPEIVTTALRRAIARRLRHWQMWPSE